MQSRGSLKLRKLLLDHRTGKPVKKVPLETGACITNLLSRGVSLARVMSIVGHTEIKTTNVYLRLAGVDVKGATDDLGYKLPQTSEAQIYQIGARKR